ncbi:MAG: hypothetical protein ABF868_06955 [Sporolactobacillus sp.]
MANAFFANKDQLMVIRFTTPNRKSWTCVKRLPFYREKKRYKKGDTLICLGQCYIVIEDHGTVRAIPFSEHFNRYCPLSVTFESTAQTVPRFNKQRL